MIHRICAVFVFLFFSMLYGQLPYIQDLIYKTPSEIENADTNFSLQVKERTANFIHLCSIGNYAEGYQQWNLLCTHFLTFKNELNMTKQKSSFPDVKAKAEEFLSTLENRFGKFLSQNGALKEQWVKNGLAAEKLSPQQRFITASILKEMQESAASDSLKVLSAYPKQSFTVMEGPTKAVPSKSLTVLTANILCFPDVLTYYYGGLAPWKERAQKLCFTLKSSGADILCLQEVWDPEIFPVLLQLLKDEYSWFVYDAGCHYGTLHPEKIIFNSGLMIVSKIPLHSIIFDPFTVVDVPQGVNRGILRAAASVGNTTISFGTTHLQYDSGPNASSIRKAQLQESYDLVEKLRDQEGGWSFLAGDLNINAFSPELSSSGMKDLFSIPYLDGQDAISADNATATDYFSDSIFTQPSKRASIAPSYKALDYCVSPRAQPKLSVSRQFLLFSIEKPSEALSDHHGILTTWELQQ